jgi:hypothetical protein
MKYSKKSLFIILLALSTSTSAQIFSDFSVLEDYDWDDRPDIHTPDTLEAKEPYFYIKNYKAHELFTVNNGAMPLQYFLKHVIIHVNTKEGIDINNKVYVPTSFIELEGLETIIKARVVKANGEVKELDEDDILEEEEDGRTYKYFALEGLESGDEIEYFYRYYSLPIFNGIQVIMQKAVPVRESIFEYYCPPHLEFNFKSYNGFAEVEEEEDDDYMRYYVEAENLKGLPEEKYTAREANLGQVIYYFSKNKSNGSSKDFYNDLTQSMGTIVYGINPKKTKIAKLVKTMEIQPNWKEEKKIRYVEDYVKSNYFIGRGEGSTSDLKSILKKKERPNNIGMLKLFAGIYRYLDIPFEVVFTSDRGELTFDEDFECALFTEDALLYFTKTKKYMSPTEITSRLGFPPSRFIGNKGLFVRFKEVAGVETTLSKIKYIKPATAEDSKDYLEIEVNLENPEKAEVDVTIKLTGYNASFLQLFYNYMTEEQQTEFVEGYITNFDEDADISKIKVKNTDIEDFGHDPLRIDASFESEVFVSKAGNKYLVNVGKMIGPQGELYQEGKRIMPVSNEYNRTYEREITIIIPEGYELGNLDSLNMEVEVEHEGEVTMMFKSEYKLDGNKLTVSVMEYYEEISLPVERYEGFKNVINAAADFNKKVIVLKKK